MTKKLRKMNEEEFFNWFADAEMQESFNHMHMKINETIENIEMNYSNEEKKKILKTLIPFLNLLMELYTEGVEDIEIGESFEILKDVLSYVINDHPNEELVQIFV